MATNGLSDFREVLTDFRQLGSLALKGVVAVPLADIGLKIGPPPSKAVGIITSLVEFVAIVWVFQFWFHIKERALRTRMKVALIVFVIGLVSSLVLLELFTVSPGQDRDRIIEGYSVRSDIKPLLNESYTPRQALRESEYDPEKIWTRESIAILRMMITILWVLTFVCFAVYLTAFIISQRRRHQV